MFCVKCGKELQENTSFCPFCGNKVNGITGDENRAVGYIDRDDFQKNYRALSKPEPSHALTICMFFALCGGIMCISAVFLPYISASTVGFHMEKTFNELAQNDYIIFVAIGVISVIFSMFKKFLGTIIFGTLYIVLYYVETHDYWENINRETHGAYITKGIGCYGMIIGSILLIILGIAGVVLKISSIKK